MVGLLTSLGYDGAEAEDGPTALIRLNERPDIGLPFTDIVPPHGMSGPNAAAKAQRLRPGLKVMFTSGYPDHQQGELSMAGAEAMIAPKPYRKAELAEMLADVLGGSGNPPGLRRRSPAL